MKSDVTITMVDGRWLMGKKQDKILVFGNGGIKDTAKWQESEELAPYVKLLIDTSRFISSRMSDGSLVLVDKEIIGNLNFTCNEEE